MSTANPNIAEPTATLDAKIEQLVSRVDDLEDELEHERTKRRELEAENEALRQKNEDFEKRFEALSRKTNFNDDRVNELQSRELEKGAHLLFKHVDPHQIQTDEGRIEKITKDDGKKYARILGEIDDIGQGEVAVGHDDLLPIQKLARFDDDMLAKESLPVQLAVKTWRERKKRVGTPGALWRSGSKNVRQYFNAGDLATEIRAWETGVSKEYAQKLASRTIAALLDLTQNRLIKKTKQRKTDGLTYREGRVIVPTDAEIPGEKNPSLETNGVGGE